MSAPPYIALNVPYKFRPMLKEWGWAFNEEYSGFTLDGNVNISSMSVRMIANIPDVKVVRKRESKFDSKFWEG